MEMKLNILKQQFEQKHKFKRAREKATNRLLMQTQKVKSMSENQFRTLTIKMTVKITVPCIDRGKV